MLYKLNKSRLENYYHILYSNLKTGTDRINKKHFSIIKDAEFNIIIRKANNETYKFSRYKKIYSNKRNVYIPTIRDRILLEFIKDTLMSKFKISFPNRDFIIESIIKKIAPSKDYLIQFPVTLIKLDIKKFFQSINCNKLIELLVNSNKVESNIIYLIREAIKYEDTGLPQGINISNILSEIYMYNFDKFANKIDSKLSFYFRYVDDMLFVFNGKLSDDEHSKLTDEIKKKLKELDLEINNDEGKMGYKIFTLQSKTNTSIDYLGYTFDVIGNSKKNFKLKVGISESKLKTINNKIRDIFINYSENKNENLLLERIKILTKKNIGYICDYYVSDTGTIKKLQKQLLYYGVIDSYRYTINDNSFSKLDETLLSYKRRYSRFLSPEAKKILYRYNFSMSHTKNLANCHFLNKKEDYIHKIIILSNKYNSDEIKNLDYDELTKIYFSLIK